MISSVCVTPSTARDRWSFGSSDSARCHLAAGFFRGLVSRRFLTSAVFEFPCRACFDTVPRSSSWLGQRTFDSLTGVRIPYGVLLLIQNVAKPGIAPVRGTGDRRFKSDRSDCNATLITAHRSSWSGRCPVTAEITGSSPVWVACDTNVSRYFSVRYANGERLVLGTSVCEFESRPHYLAESVRTLSATYVHGVCRIRTRPCDGRRPGSIPGVDTCFPAWKSGNITWPTSVMDSTAGFEPAGRGSNPLWATYLCRTGTLARRNS
jgi:hypothetical protein